MLKTIIYIFSIGTVCSLAASDKRPDTFRLGIKNPFLLSQQDSCSTPQRPPANPHPQQSSSEYVPSLPFVSPQRALVWHSVCKDLFTDQAEVATCTVALSFIDKAGNALLTVKRKH